MSAPEHSHDRVIAARERNDDVPDDRVTQPDPERADEGRAALVVEQHEGLLETERTKQLVQ